MTAKSPHPSDPKGGQKKYIVGKIESMLELRTVTERIPWVLNAVITSSTHPSQYTFLTAMFTTFLDQIHTSNEAHPNLRSTVSRMVDLVNMKLHKWFKYLQTYYARKEDRPTRDDMFYHCRELLNLSEAEIMADAHRLYPIPDQFSNEWIPPRVAPAAAAGGGQPKGGPVPGVQPKGTIPNPPGTNPNKKRKATPLVPVAAVPGSGAAPLVGPKLSDQLCLNKFAGDIGVGPTCNKKPGSKGYPCVRNHNFAPPPAGSKWPTSILDAAVDAANRVGSSNPSDFAASLITKVVGRGGGRRVV